MTDASSRLGAILTGDPARWRILGLVRFMRLPDCWIGAGFVRNAVWDHLHGRSPSLIAGDVDVLWFDPERATPAEDRRLEDALRAVDPSIQWSVKNQARMHVRNGDAPYASAIDAMRFWPETATAVAARRDGHDVCEVAAPFGLDDLFGLLLRPTLHFAHDKRAAYEARTRAKDWMATWPLLRADHDCPALPPPSPPDGAPPKLTL